MRNEESEEVFSRQFSVIQRESEKHLRFASGTPCAQWFKFISGSDSIFLFNFRFLSFL